MFSLLGNSQILHGIKDTVGRDAIITEIDKKREFVF